MGPLVAAAFAALAFWPQAGVLGQDLYRWSAGGKVLRALTSAALSDVLVRGAAKPGQTLRCDVTATDGKLAARTASAKAQVPGAR